MTLQATREQHNLARGAERKKLDRISRKWPSG